MVNTIQLQKRRIAKRRKPSFVVKESHFIARVKKRWRLPRGLHSAARQRYRGRPAQPHPGYGSPQEVRGLSREGLIPVRVHTERDFSLLTPGVHGAVIGRSVGSRKKLALLQLAQEKKIKIIYVKDVFSLVTKMKETLARRQEVRRSQKQEKMKKQVEHRKKSAEKEKKEDKVKAGEEKTENQTAPGKEITSAGRENTINVIESSSNQHAEKDEERKLAEKTMIKRQ
ncbi:hypothetical protein J4210_01340 [Candidatus Woesearchaeota archaeon]|nr:hypothetical protein [Candidatus Woesearchaeota archaeon]